MRIVCPRCVAQYEVDESAIPQAGREVQCANCENIWFQDYIEMLPDRNVEDEDSERGVFDDLDGKDEVSFQTTRHGALTEKEPSQGPVADSENLSAEAIDDILPDSTEDEFYNIGEENEGFDDDDDEPSSDIEMPPLDEGIREVLKSEAAFSSARAQLDQAASKALDRDGAERIAALDALDAEETPQSMESPSSQEVEVDDLTAFLDAHTENQEEVSTSQLEDELETEEAPDTENDAPSFDPLADLDAIRSQLDDIGKEEKPEYTPILPQEDPIVEKMDIAVDDFISEISEADPEPLETTASTDFEVSDDFTPESFDPIELEKNDPENDESTFDASSFAAALEGISDDGIIEVEDDESEKPRHAYRADGGKPDSSNDPEDLTTGLPDLHEADDEETQDNPETGETNSELEQEVSAEENTVRTGGGAAAAAMGLSRPRVKSGRARARGVPGFEMRQAEPLQDSDDLAAELQEKIEAAADAPERTPDPARRPKKTRKMLLPDVDELDASLRSDVDADSNSEETPRRRDREMMEAHEDDLKKAAGGGFRRAFIWTVFIIAVLVALYVFHPSLTKILPVSAVILDPYAAGIDGLRLMIDGLIGG